MRSDDFEWDDAKAEANWRKHKVRFEHGAEACEDPFALIELDDSRQPRKSDIRLFTYDGAVLLAAARLYQGQATNFRTPGGGFAPVFFL